MGKIAIVTGGTLGIGAAVVDAFIKEKHTVYNLDINEAGAEKQNVNFIKCDVSDTQQINNAIDEINKKEKRVDILVCNAGKHLSANIENTTEEQFDDMVALNIKGTFFALKAVLPIMRAQQSGRVVIIGSDQTFIGRPNSAAYGLTKGAISQLTKGTALDYAKHNIQINCVCPGQIDTPLFQTAIKKYSDKQNMPLDDVKKEMAAEQPIGRTGRPEEVAELVNFLCSCKAEYMTGGFFPIDGGYTAQ